MLAFASLACAQYDPVPTATGYVDGAYTDTGYATPDGGYAIDAGYAIGPDYVEAPSKTGDYVTTDTDDDYIPPVPDVVYGSGYGTAYYAGDPLAELWKDVWKKYHIMKWQVQKVEDYRDEITMQVNKLSQKVFAWCRSKNNVVCVI